MTARTLTRRELCAILGATGVASVVATCDLARHKKTSGIPVPTRQTGESVGSFDTLFAMDPIDEKTVLSENGTMTGHGESVFSVPPQPRAILGAGPFKRKSVRSAPGGGVLAYPCDGILPVDQFRISCWARSIQHDAGALSSAYIFNFVSRGQYFALYATGGVLSCLLNVDERPFAVSGRLNQLEASLPLVTGDIPPERWTHITVTFDGTNLGLAIGDRKISASSAKRPAAWLSRPFMGDPVTGTGLAIGTDSVSAAAGAAKWEVSDLEVHRYADPHERNVVAKPATISIDARIMEGEYPRYIAGLVNNYSGYSHDETDRLPAVRDAQIAISGAAGAPIVRMPEIHFLAVPESISSNTVGKIDFTRLDSRWSRFQNAGFDMHLSLGFTPALFASSQYLAPTNTAAYTDWASKAISHILDVGYRLKFVSFWNEPDQGFWRSSPAQFGDLWVALARRLQEDHPQLPFGGVDGLWTVGESPATMYQRVIIDAAKSNDLPLPFLCLHDYTNNLTLTRELMADMRSYAASKGFLNIPVQVPEWNSVLGKAEVIPTYLASQEQRRVTPYNAAYVHAHCCEVLAGGGSYSAFYRLGKEPGIGEGNLGLLGIDPPAAPTPSWGALSLLWKHLGTRIRATANWPNLRVLASIGSDVSVVVSYSSLRTWRAKEMLSTRVEWRGLPTACTWNHWKVDYSVGVQGRPILVGSGDQTNLPTLITHTAVGMGAIEIKRSKVIAPSVAAASPTGSTTAPGPPGGGGVLSSR